MTKCTEILVENKNRVSIITIRTKGGMNVISMSMVAQLKDAIKHCAECEESDVILIRAEGKNFCAGGDIHTMAALENMEDKLRFIQYSADIVTIIFTTDKPVVMAVNGMAVGAGFNYILAADYVFAEPDSKFMLAFSKLGLVPDAGGTYFLPKAVGLKKAKELYLTNRMMDANEAYELGIVNCVVDCEKLEEQALRFAEKIAQEPLGAYAMAKKLFNRSLDYDMMSALNAETYAQTLLMNTADHKEGVAAFLEKREPQYRK